MAQLWANQLRIALDLDEVEVIVKLITTLRQEREAVGSSGTRIFFNTIRAVVTNGPTELSIRSKRGATCTHRGLGAVGTSLSAKRIRHGISKRTEGGGPSITKGNCHEQWHRRQHCLAQQAQVHVEKTLATYNYNPLRKSGVATLRRRRPPKHGFASYSLREKTWGAMPPRTRLQLRLRLRLQLQLRLQLRLQPCTGTSSSFWIDA